MNFIFECSTRYLTSERSERVRCGVEHCVRWRYDFLVKGEILVFHRCLCNKYVFFTVVRLYDFYLLVVQNKLALYVLFYKTCELKSYALTNREVTYQYLFRKGNFSFHRAILSIVILNFIQCLIERPNSQPEVKQNTAHFKQSRLTRYAYKNH